MRGLLDSLKAPARRLQQERLTRQLSSLTKAQLKRLLKDDDTYRIKPLRNKIYGELIRRVRANA